MRYLAALPILAALATTTMQPGPTHLTVSRTAENSHGPGTRTVTLRCDPPAGTHPSAGPACDALIDANGDFRRLTPIVGPCTMEYSPVLITASGTWRGATVTYRQQFANACAASQIPVFAF